MMLAKRRAVAFILHSPNSVDFRTHHTLSAAIEYIHIYIFCGAALSGVASGPAGPAGRD